VGVAKTFVDRLNGVLNGSREDSTSVFSDELKAGAYAAGGITAQVQLQAVSGHEVIIYNVRPVIRQKRDVVTGAVVGFAGAAGGIHTIWYQLDRSNSVAKDNDPNGPPFFTTQRIGLTKSNPETLILKFGASAASYDFNIAIDYEVNGQKFSQMVKWDKGGPDLLLRASGSVCDRPMDAQEHATIQSPPKLGYQQTFRLVSYTDLTSYQIVPVDPSAFIAHGCA
jgi:hypothetical protein